MAIKEIAPKKGTIYATFIDKMIYEEYGELSEIEEYLSDKNLLELHLFDKEREARLIKTAGKGFCEYEITAFDEGRYDDCYCESLYLSGENIDKHDNLNKKVEVVNYIKYDENDMIRIVNYRLKEVE